MIHPLQQSSQSLHQEHTFLTDTSPPNVRGFYEWCMAAWEPPLSKSPPPVHKQVNPSSNPELTAWALIQIGDSSTYMIRNNDMNWWCSHILSCFVLCLGSPTLPLDSGTWIRLNQDTAKWREQQQCSHIRLNHTCTENLHTHEQSWAWRHMGGGYMWHTWPTEWVHVYHLY